MWSESYQKIVNRNIGILTAEQQEALNKSCMVVFGLGGLGGVIAQILARSGVSRLKIVDNDKFDPTNLNRQIFAYQDTIGLLKTEVTEKFLKEINPEIKIEKFTEVTPKNINQIFENTALGVLAIDSLKPCIVISRAARKLGLSLVEGWALPFGNVRVFTPDTPSLEEVYGLPTQGRDIETISEQELMELKLHMLLQLKKIEGIEAFYPPLAIERIMKGEIPSFAPIVWLNAVLMSLEAIKVFLNWGTPALSPRFSLYDPFKQKIPAQEA